MIMLDASAQNFVIPEITARGGTENDARPAWYNPNNYSRYVRIFDIAGRRTFFVDLDKTSELSEIGGTPLKDIPVEERIAILQQYAAPDEDGMPSNQHRSNGVKSAQTRDSDSRRIRQNEDTARFLQKTGLPSRSADMAKQVKTTNEPEFQVEFQLIGVPAKFIGYYHGVILNAPYIILVVDKRAIGYQHLELNVGAEVRMTIQKKDLVNIPCVATGLNFEYDKQQFSVFLVQPQPEKEEQEEEDERHTAEVQRFSLKDIEEDPNLAEELSKLLEDDTTAD